MGAVALRRSRRTGGVLAFLGLVDPGLRVVGLAGSVSRRWPRSSGAAGKRPLAGAARAGQRRLQYRRPRGTRVPRRRARLLRVPPFDRPRPRPRLRERVADLGPSRAARHRHRAPGEPLRDRARHRLVPVLRRRPSLRRDHALPGCPRLGAGRVRGAVPQCSGRRVDHGRGDRGLPPRPFHAGLPDHGASRRRGGRRRARLAGRLLHVRGPRGWRTRSRSPWPAS